MIYKGAERGFLPTAEAAAVEDVIAKQADSITTEVIQDTPRFDELPEDIKELLLTVANKAAVAGLTESEPELVRLDEQDTAIVLDYTLDVVGVGPSTAYVTHHDVRQAAEVAIQQTQSMMLTGDVEFQPKNNRYEE